MIQEFVDIFQKHKDSPEFTEKVAAASDYDDLVKALIELLHEHHDEYGETPDPKRITVIDHGHYQGTRLFIIGSKGYQPDTYYSIFVNYGSCSGCDTFLSYDNSRYDEELDETIKNFKTMILHMVQEMKKL